MNEAFTKMTAATELNNMQSVQVAQMMLKAGYEKLQETCNTFYLIWANQKDRPIRKRLDLKSLEMLNSIT